MLEIVSNSMIAMIVIDMSVFKRLLSNAVWHFLFGARLFELNDPGVNGPVTLFIYTSPVPPRSKLRLKQRSFADLLLEASFLKIKTQNPTTFVS